jgi:hypothetical protein
MRPDQHKTGDIARRGLDTVAVLAQHAHGGGERVSDFGGWNELFIARLP